MIMIVRWRGSCYALTSASPPLLCSGIAASSRPTAALSPVLDSGITTAVVEAFRWRSLLSTDPAPEPAAPPPRSTGGFIIARSYLPPSRDAQRFAHVE